MSPRRRRELGFLPLVAVLFFNVSGGPYGVEDAVGSLGPGLALLLLLVTPLVWSLPVALAMGELASALPEEGGYVVWVQRAFGRFWGFQAGWWSWINSFVDVAVYPALFAEYLATWRPGMSPLERWVLALAKRPVRLGAAGLGIVVALIGAIRITILVIGWISSGAGDFFETDQLVLAAALFVFGLQLMSAGLFVSMFSGRLAARRA